MRKHYGWSLAVFLALAMASATCSKDSPTTPSPSCTFSLSTSSLSFGAGGGANSVGVVTAAGCSWTAASDRGWMSITGGASGTGPGTVSVNLAANSGDATRSGTLTIAGLAVAVLQDGLSPCTIGISPTSASYSKDAVTGTFAVTAAAHCQWTATSAAGWITITGGSPGSGNGTVTYAVERNRDLTDRTGTMTVANRTFTITQRGDTPMCEYSVAPVEVNACMSVPFNLTTTVTTQPGCIWTANPDASWITVTDGSSGSGSGTITFRVTENWDLPRLGNVMVRWPTPTAGQNVRVLQAGCRYAVSVAAFNIAASGGTGRFDVIQASDPITCGGPLQNACRWTAETNVPWITITTSMPQVGDNPVSFTVSENTSTSPRTGTIVVRDKTVVITQSGR